MMPNYRTMVEKRENYLYKRFMKKMLLEDYKRFMNGMLQKASAWVVLELQSYGKTWYISHHGI